MCTYGECKYFKNGRCTKENEIAKMSMEELVEALTTKKCKLRKSKKQ